MTTLLLVFMGFTSVSQESPIEFTDENLLGALLSSNYHTDTGSRPIDANNDGVISMSEAQAITGTIHVPNRGISSLEGMEFFENLEEFEFGYNQVASMAPLENIQSLTKITAAFNLITDWSLPSNVRLVNLGNNAITGVLPLRFEHLEHLVLSSNNILGLSVESAPKLGILACAVNSIGDLDLSLAPELKILEAGWNELTQVNLPDGITNVNLKHNHFEQMQNLPTSIEILSLDFNEIQALPDLDVFENLLSLSIRGNQLTNIRSIAVHPLLGTLLGDCGLDGCNPRYYLDIRDNLLSCDDCTDIEAILDKAPLDGFPQFSFDPETLCANSIDELWVPHLTRNNGGFTTKLHFTNVTTTPGEIEITVYGEDGLVLDSENLMVESSSQFTLKPAMFVVGASHMRIALNDVIIQASAVYQSVNDGAPAHVPATQRYGHRFYAHVANSQMVFDGLALINLGDSPATITVTSYDENLTPLSDSQALGQLDPLAKGLFLLDEVLVDIDANAVSIESTQPSIALFLRGTPPDVQPGYLFANVPFAVE